MEEVASADDAFPAAGLQFAAAHDASMDASTGSHTGSDPNPSILDSQEIVVGDSGRAIVLGDDDDLESDGGDPPPPPPAKGWLRGSPPKTKGFLALASVLFVGFVAILVVGVVQLSASPAEEENQFQVDESMADPTNAVPAPVPGPVTPAPIPAPVPDSMTVPISGAGVDVSLPPSLEAKVPDFSDGLTAEEEEDWELIQGNIESTIYESLAESLPEGYELAPVQLVEFDGYLTSELRMRHLRNERMLQNGFGTIHTAIYSTSVEVDCQIYDCTVATDTVTDATDTLSEVEYLQVSWLGQEDTPSPVASTPAPITPSPTLGAQPSVSPTNAPSAKPVTASPTPPVMLTDREDDCNIYTPCERCVGECADDDECEEGLLCFRRRNFEFIPGCEGPGERGHSYCYDPFSGGLTEEQLLIEQEEECDKKDRCGKCRGECDDEDGCEDGLFCFRRNEFELVPGCAGQGTFGTNYCFDPADLQNMWDDKR